MQQLASLTLPVHPNIFLWPDILQALILSIGNETELLLSIGNETELQCIVTGQQKAVTIGKFICKNKVKITKNGRQNDGCQK